MKTRPQTEIHPKLTAQMAKENSKLATQIKEFAKENREAAKENREAARENREAAKENRERNRQLWEQMKATDARLNRLFAETNAQFKETDKKINKTHSQFTSQWSKMMETLVKPNALNLFKTWGVNVTGSLSSLEQHRNGQTMELDLVLHNSGELVVLEVKSTLKVTHVDELLEDLSQFDDFFPSFRYNKLYGAVAALNFHEEANRYAYKKGLFVIGFTGEGMTVIKNNTPFKPHNFTKQ